MLASWQVSKSAMQLVRVYVPQLTPVECLWTQHQLGRLLQLYPLATRRGQTRTRPQTLDYARL
eukprot:6181555-Pleurochrysis_carterae.AAC.10